MFRHPRAIAALLPCVAISAMILFATPLPASAQHIDTTHPVPLVNAGSAKCFSPTPQDDHFDWAGLPIQQRTCDTGLTTQFWIFVPLGFVPINDQGWFPCWGCIPAGTDGFFIKNDFTGLCMDARDGAKSDGSVVQQWTCRDKNARSMVWYVEPGDFPDALRVRNLNSDLCLDVRGGSSDEAVQLQQYHCTSNNMAQNFWQTLFLTDIAMDLRGNWTDGSARSAVIYAGNSSIIIEMSGFGRPNANGRIINNTTITVTFPDDRTYTGQLQPPSTIRWSNNSIWTKKP